MTEVDFARKHSPHLVSFLDFNNTIVLNYFT